MRCSSGIGENYEYRYVNLWPRPVQQPHPPVYIPGAGSTETMKFCALHRYTFMSVYAPTRVVRLWFDGYRRAAADLGYVPDPEKIALSVPVYVADTDEKAHREAEPALTWLFRQGAQADHGDGQPARLHVARARCAGCCRSTASRSPRCLTRNCWPTGTRWSAARPPWPTRLAAMHEQLGGYGQLIGLFAIGPATREQTRRSTELFAVRGDAGAAPRCGRGAAHER